MHAECHQLLPGGRCPRPLATYRGEMVAGKLAPARLAGAARGSRFGVLGGDEGDPACRIVAGLGTIEAMILAIAPLTDVKHWLRSSGLLIVLYLLGAVLLTRFATWLEQRVTERIDARDASTDALVRSETAKHRHAVIQVLTWSVLVLLYCVTAVLIVVQLGIPLSGFVAPATVVGVALGIGAQRVVGDILAGFFIIVERQYGFGDVISIASVGIANVATGTVEEVTLRITRLRSVNGEVYIVPNGLIAHVINLSRDWARAVIDIPVPTSVDVGQAIEILHRVGADFHSDGEWQPLLLDPPSVMGVETMDVDEFQVRIVARTLPGKQFEVGRELRARIATAFRQEGITLSTSLDTAPPSGASE